MIDCEEIAREIARFKDGKILKDCTLDRKINVERDGPQFC